MQVLPRFTLIARGRKKKRMKPTVNVISSAGPHLPGNNELGGLSGLGLCVDYTRSNEGPRVKRERNGDAMHSLILSPSAASFNDDGELGARCASASGWTKYDNK